MAAGGEKITDFYALLGLKKECSEAELRNAYKKLALRWHPDRCSASGNSKFVEQAKEKFQAIQEAYSVLSDTNKRFLYDVGVYNNDDDENGMGDFLGEMAQMMSQTKPNENGHETFEELQQLFVEMFQADIDAGFGSPTANGPDRATSTSSSSTPFWIRNNGSSKRSSSSVMNSAGKGKLDELDTGPGGFCYGLNNSGDPMKGRGGSNNSKRRNGRKQKVSSKHDVSSSCNAGISY